MTNLGTSTVPREEYKWIPFASEVPVPIKVPGEEYERILLATVSEVLYSTWRGVIVDPVRW